MHRLSLIAALAITTSMGLAQSSTLPKGFDTKPGNNYFWGGFSIASTPTTAYKYYVARSVFLYDSATFPWDATKAKIIDKISFRRSATQPNANATAHKAGWVVIISTSTQPANTPNTKFDANHGSNKTVVFGSPTKPKLVSFLATPKPATGKAAPFDVTLDINNFVVPPNSKTLVIEIRSYSSDVKSGTWYADCDLQPGTGYNGGTNTTFYGTHCISPGAFYTNRANYLNNNFGHVWRTGRKAGLPVIGIAGTKLASGVKVPNTASCEWHINPLIYALAVTSNGPSNTANPGQGGVYLDWGRVPNDPKLVGIKLAHQALIIDPTANTLGIGITRGRETSIGSGYDLKVTKVSAVYSYGAQNILSNRIMDPNKETYSKYFYRRVPILKIQ